MKPALVPRVGLGGILFYVGRRSWLTCLVSSLGVADIESTASVPRTGLATDGWSITLPARIPRLPLWVLRLSSAIIRIGSDDAYRAFTVSRKPDIAVRPHFEFTTGDLYHPDGRRALFGRSGAGSRLIGLF